MDAVLNSNGSALMTAVLEDIHRCGGCGSPAAFGSSRIVRPKRIHYGFPFSEKENQVLLWEKCRPNRHSSRTSLCGQVTGWSDCTLCFRIMVAVSFQGHRLRDWPPVPLRWNDGQSGFCNVLWFPGVRGALGVSMFYLASAQR